MDTRTLEIVLKARDQATGVIENANRRIGGSLAGIGSTLGRVAAAAGGLYAVKRATDFFVGTVDAASDMNETLNKAQVVFGEYAAEIVKLGESAATSIGLVRNRRLERLPPMAICWFRLNYPRRRVPKWPLVWYGWPVTWPASTMSIRQ